MPRDTCQHPHPLLAASQQMPTAPTPPKPPSQLGGWAATGFTRARRRRRLTDGSGSYTATNSTSCGSSALPIRTSCSKPSQACPTAKMIFEPAVFVFLWYNNSPVDGRLHVKQPDKCQSCTIFFHVSRKSINFNDIISPHRGKSSPTSRGRVSRNVSCLVKGPTGGTGVKQCACLFHAAVIVLSS